MKVKNDKKMSRANTFLILLAVAVSLMVVPANVTAKSLYVIADIGQPSADKPTPVQAYHIEADGSLTLQAEYGIPRRMLGAVGITIDTDHGFLFITYEASDEIQLVDARTMTDEGTTTAPDARDLAGVVYDHDKSLLYCVNRRGYRVYAYNWDPENKTLTHIPGSPFNLRGASAYGIALNEVDGLLYVANGTNEVTVYRTSDWRLVDTITLNRVAISVAVGVVRGFLYTGGGFVGNQYLTQYHLATGTVKEVQVEPDDAGVMGLGVDPATGYVYLTTGVNNAPGGDNLLVFDTNLRQIGMIPKIGNPTGLVVPGREFSYDPLNLSKTLVRGGSGTMGSDDIPSVRVGATITYGIHFDNNNDFIVTDVVVSDQLPEEVTFITADDNTVNGHYDPETHTYEWSYPSLPLGTSTDLELTVEVNKGVETGTVITNNVTISSAQTAPTTKSFDVIAESHSLNLTKRISGVAEGQVAWVEADELITYTICFDNRNSDLPVTNVTVVDYLPEEVKFIDLGKETPSGTYDATEHTYTWTFSSLEPGEAVCLNMNVKVNKDVAPAIIITNTVIVDSDETPTSMASVEAITYLNPLNLTKRISGVAEGQIAWVDADEPMTYTICFDNSDNDLPVTNVIVVDYLPDEVRFVGLGADTPSGKYDTAEHTYTWLFPSLAPGEAICLDVNVQVNKDVDPGTTIINNVIVDSDETQPSPASIEAITYLNPLNLTKSILGTPEGQTALVSADGPVTYIIQFDNDNDFTVTNISVFDVLPEEVSFVSAEGDLVSGKYDPVTHTYTWIFPFLEPGKAIRLELNGRVDKGLSKDTIFTNSVTVESDETPPSTATADAIVSDKLFIVREMKVLPEIIRRIDNSYDIQASIIFPEGIGKDDILDVLPILYPGKITAKQQFVYGTADRLKVIALFDKTELLNAVPGYGQVTLKMVGLLTSNRSYLGEATVYITKYTGR